MKDIITAFNTGKNMNYNKYKNKKNNGNILKQGVINYHKELRILPPPPVVDFDLNTGTLTSLNKPEHYSEPVASYTMKQLYAYLKSKINIDEAEFPDNRLYGIFNNLIGRYGIDKVLFMIEAFSRYASPDGIKFGLNEFNSYSQKATEYINQIKNNIKMTGDEPYVPKRRVLSR